MKKIWNHHKLPKALKQDSIFGLDRFCVKPKQNLSRNTCGGTSAAARVTDGRKSRGATDYLSIVSSSVDGEKHNNHDNHEF